jgi:hypothetical protein
MDRGMTSAENLTWLRERRRRDLVATPTKSELRTWARQIADAQDWHAVRDSVEATQCTGSDGAETFVPIRSVERREKERAMHDRVTRRIEDGLARLGRRLQQGRRALDARHLERQLGSLLALNACAAGRSLLGSAAWAAGSSGSLDYQRVGDFTPPAFRQTRSVRAPASAAQPFSWGGCGRGPSRPPPSDLGSRG